MGHPRVLPLLAQVAFQQLVSLSKFPVGFGRLAKRLEVRCLKTMKYTPRLLLIIPMTVLYLVPKLKQHRVCEMTKKRVEQGGTCLERSVAGHQFDWIGSDEFSYAYANQCRKYKKVYKSKFFFLAMSTKSVTTYTGHVHKEIFYK